MSTKRVRERERHETRHEQADAHPELEGRELGDEESDDAADGERSEEVERPARDEIELHGRHMMPPSEPTADGQALTHDVLLPRTRRPCRRGCQREHDQRPRERTPEETGAFLSTASQHKLGPPQSGRRLLMASARRILIIGSGFGGLGLAIRLKRAGIESFTILEKAATLGGTWRDNTYPGAACDVPSMLYSFSFEPKTDWTRKWSGQAEIHAYMDDCARRNDILRHVRFGVEVASARFDETRGTWTVRTTTGEELVAEVLVSSVGQLHRPQIPKLPGLESFRGPSFHSARWNHDVDLAGKRVGVVGNAASAIQFIPEIAKEVAHLTIFQRSANWMIARGDRPFHPWESWILTHVPGALRFYRLFLWGFAELLLYPVMRQKPALARLYTKWALANLETHVSDPELRARLTPDYPIGGKRILIHDDFFPALGRPNVELVTSPIERVTEDGVVTADGTTRQMDVAHLRHRLPHQPVLGTHEDRRRRWAEPRGRLGARRARLLRPHHDRLPELLHALRPQHQPRPQLDHLHARVPDRLRHGRDPVADRRTT